MLSGHQRRVPTFLSWKLSQRSSLLSTLGGIEAPLGGQDHPATTEPLYHQGACHPPHTCHLLTL